MRPTALLALLALLLVAVAAPALAVAQSPGAITPGGGPPLRESMDGRGRPAAEPHLARTGSEPLVVALAGLGLLLCGAGLRVRLGASA